jgi:intein/homing endonuclease
MGSKEKNKLENIDLSKLSDKEKRDLILSMRRLGGKKGSQKRAAPTTDDELHSWIREEIGDNIPRVAVCPDHCAPFDFMKDYYFERETALLVMAARETGKTRGVAIINYAIAETKSGVEICVAGDTLVDCPRDHRKYPDGIPISVIEPGHLIWTFNEDNFIFELKRIKQVKLTHKDCQLYKLNLDDGSVIRATADHKFLRRNGEWAKLCDLKFGDSLMPMYRDFEPYVRIRPDATGGGEKISEYKAVANFKWEDRKGFHVDHIDEVHANSGEDNLQLLTVSEHASKTMKGRNVGFRRKQQQKAQMNSVYDVKRSKAEKEILEKLKDIPEDQLTIPQMEALDRYYATSENGEVKFICNICREEFVRRMNGRDRIPLCNACKTEGRICPVCREPYTVERYSKNKTCSRRCGQILKHQVYSYKDKKCAKCENIFTPKNGSTKNCPNCQSRYFQKYERSRRREIEHSKYYNHKVCSIEKDGIEDVWDLEVEDNHNFVSCGVVLHNCAFAEIEAQTEKSYSYIKEFVYNYDDDNKKNIKSSILGEPLRKMTQWKNGSKLLLIVATLGGVNAQHSQKVYADEIDLMKKEIFYESRSISSSKTLKDGTIVKAQDIATSTRKSNKGVMQEIMDECDKAEKEGFDPPWTRYIFCIFEVSQENPACRAVPKENREARLKELEKDPCELCDCDKVVKGEWSQGSPRTLESVCKGRFFRSRGWMAHADVKRKFVQNIPQVWVAQLECKRPLADGLYLPTWNREKHTIRDYEPRPEYGYIWMGVDWGGSSQSLSSILWIQGPLHQPLQVNNSVGTKTVIPQGAYVIFNEINESVMGATRLADKVVRQEIQYRNRFGGAWRVKGRFADKAGAQQRSDWREHNPPLRTHWYLSGKYFDSTTECLQALVTDDLLYVDDQKCPGTADDFESWRSQDGREVHDDSSHNPAAARYCLKNVQGIVKRYKNPRPTLQPMVAARDSAVNPTAALVGVGSVSSDEYGSEAWRKSFGQEIGGNNGRGNREPWMP